jgi:hypothetical protein
MKANRKLLQDILHEASNPLRQAAFEVGLRELRRRRRITRIQRVMPLAMAAVLVLSICLFYVSLAHRGRNEARLQPESAQPGPALAYPPMEVVVSHHWPAMPVVESGQYQSLIVDNSTVQRPVEVLDDTALLAQFPNKPVGLIASANGLVQLVFLNPGDQILVPAN